MLTCANCARKGWVYEKHDKTFSQWLGFPLTSSGGGRPCHEMGGSIYILLVWDIGWLLLSFFPFHWNCHWGEVMSQFFPVCISGLHAYILKDYDSVHEGKHLEELWNKFWVIRTLSWCQLQHNLISNPFFIAMSQIELLSYVRVTPM